MSEGMALCLSISSVYSCAVLTLLIVSALSYATAIRRYPYFSVPDIDGLQGRQPIQTQRAFNIAHRGSNGEIPEATAEAFLRAIDEGADFIETDITATKDGRLICFHDLILDDTTDVADHAEFQDRIHTYEDEGKNVTGYFAGTLSLGPF
jgi:glycerophosphoryl diester phosphodiesterase